MTSNEQDGSGLRVRTVSAAELAKEDAVRVRRIVIDWPQLKEDYKPTRLNPADLPGVPWVHLVVKRELADRVPVLGDPIPTSTPTNDQVLNGDEDISPEEALLGNLNADVSGLDESERARLLQKILRQRSVSGKAIGLPLTKEGERFEREPTAALIDIEGAITRIWEDNNGDEVVEVSAYIYPDSPSVIYTLLDTHWTEIVLDGAIRELVNLYKVGQAQIGAWFKCSLAFAVSREGEPGWWDPNNRMTPRKERGFMRAIRRFMPGSVHEDPESVKEEPDSDKPRPKRPQMTMLVWECSFCGDPHGLLAEEKKKGVSHSENDRILTSSRSRHPDTPVAIRVNGSHTDDAEDAPADPWYMNACIGNGPQLSPAERIVMRSFHRSMVAFWNMVYGTHSVLRQLEQRENRVVPSASQRLPTLSSFYQRFRPLEGPKRIFN